MKKMLLGAFILAGCASDAPQRAVSTFEGQPISLAVSHMEVVNTLSAFKNTSEQASVEERVTQAVEHWAKKTFVPQGNAGHFFFTIESVTFKRDALAKATKGIEGFFTKDQEEKLDATVTTRIEFRNNKGEVVRTGVVSASKLTTLPEGFTLNEKKAKLEEFIQGLIKDLDERMRAALEDNMSGVDVSEL